MSIPSSLWIQTHNGGVYDYDSSENSTPITPHTIAHSLARTYRFRGHSRYRWTVAEHSLLVRNIGMQLLSSNEERLLAAPYLLLHDAHEAFLGDMPAPLKKYLREKYKFDMTQMEKLTDKRIRKDLKLNPPNGWVLALIGEADIYALKLEREAFMASKHEWVIDEIKIPIDIKVALEKELSAQTLTRVFRNAIQDAIHATQPTT